MADTSPDVVTCMIKLCKFSSGRALPASERTYQDEPTIMSEANEVAPSTKKNGVIGWFGSSTMLGSAAPSMPEVEAGPVKPMVAYVSSTISGKLAKKAGLMPDALQEELKFVLYAPAGTFTYIAVSALP